MKTPIGKGLILTSIFLQSISAADWPGDKWVDRPAGESGLNQARLEQARDYALTGGGSGIIIHRGQAVMRWGDQRQTYDLKSTSKSIGGTVLGLALQDGLVTSLDESAIKIHPTFGTPPDSNKATDWLPRITLLMLANQTAGFAKRGGYEPLLFEPDTKWHYSDCGPNWLAECMAIKYGRDLNEVLFDRVFDQIGITPKDLRWRRHQYRPRTFNGVARREFGSGFHANVTAMARIGYLYLRDGWWRGEKILPREFIDAIRNPSPHLQTLKTHEQEKYGEAAPHYGMLWWNNRDGTLAGLPKDATWSWGLYDSLILVVPSLDLVVARAGKSLKRKGWSGHYDVLKPFFEPIAAAITTRTAAPPSPVIRTIRWAPKNSIIRLAKGSDNWPLTWADDGHLYTAYGDGWGFEPKVKSKLSLGLARVEGAPPNLRGVNIRSATAESKGGGKHGRKASGMLMIDGVLYMWVRNAGNSHLGWSRDHGRAWEWADWKFTTSFGCPTFLNYGKNYAGARDEYVYLYSQDAETAYDRANRFVLARAPKQHLRDRSQYTFFAGRAKGQPTWTKNIKDRAAVFSNPSRCYRSSVSYHPGLKRYLWCQTGPGGDTRFSGGFTILDAPEPWGPWTTAFHTEKWDVGPGESMHLPTKWISGDTIWLAFSGDDHFSIRRGKIIDQ